MESFHKVLLLGASGSIGGQTIDIINEAKEKFVLTAFSVGHNLEKAKEILRNFNSVKHVYICDKNHALELKKEFPKIKVFYGNKGLVRITKAAD